MLFLLFVVLFLTCVFACLFSPWKRALFVCAMYLSFAVMLFGIYTFFIKTGGFTLPEKKILLGGSFLFKRIGRAPIRFSTLALFIAFGRIAFAGLFFFEGCLKNLRIRNTFSLHPRLCLLALMPAVVLASLMVPKIFSTLFAYDFSRQRQVSDFVYFCLVCYVALGLIARLSEYHDTMLSWYRKRQRSLVLSRFLLAVQYLFYAYFDPIMVFQNYSSVKISRNFFPFSQNKNIQIWAVLFALTLLSSVIMAMQDWRYFRYEYDRSRKELTIRQKVDDAALVSSALIHGLKNQLLVAEILIRDLRGEVARTGCGECLRSVDAIEMTAMDIQKRIDIVYRSFVKVTTVFSSCPSQALMTLVRNKVEAQKGQGLPVSYQVTDGYLLADKELLSEAVSNVVCNAIEAVGTKVDGNVKVSLSFTRAKTVIRVEDNGMGISAAVRNKLFTPFTSTKNSLTNWGMGLCYANIIIRKHQGEIVCEKSNSSGTTFMILLPRFFTRREEGALPRECGYGD